MTTTATPNYTWRFFRAGSFDQVRLTSGADLAHLAELDQKLWVALSCPVRGLEFDETTLGLMDTDKDGRIRVPEVIAAVRWTLSMLRTPDSLFQGARALPLAVINDQTPEGQQLLTAARKLLEQTGKKDAQELSVEDTAEAAKRFAQSRFNGDGIVPADAAEDAGLQAVIQDIVAAVGGETDRSGKPGVSQAKVEQFFSEAQAHVDWHRKAEEAASAILPLGEGTAPALAAVRGVKSKVDDYFARCRLATFDPRALTALNREEKEYLALAAKDLTITAAEVAAFPLARVEAGRALPLKEGLNPAWAEAIARLQADAVKPLLGDKLSLTEGDWATLAGKLGAYECWVTGKAGAAVEKLGLKRLREILGGKAKEALAALIAEDKKLEPEFTAISAVDKLVRFHRDLVTFLNNFVSFRDFYDPERWATFQAGTLYLDQRSCQLCLRVDDPGKHVALAGLAKAYLAYCDCTRPSGEKMTIVAAFTGGDSDHLMVGRNGIFYDRKGRDWDATITKVVENPISVRQAFWAPYKKAVRLAEEMVAKRAAAAEAASDAKLAGAAATAATADKAKPAEARKVDVGTVAAMGVAFGALATAFAALAGYLSGVLKLPFWQVCLAFAGILLLISGPSMLIAWLKLRQRNLGPILDASGWAVNGRVKINVPFGGSLTAVAKLPPGAQAAMDDPYGEPPRVWPKLLGFVVILCFVYSLLNSYGLIHAITGGKLGQDPAATQQKVDNKPSAPGDSSGSSTNTPAA